ncbi:hypothetical protein [Elizabethkingia anophelis]|uniref:hypothetical protein n=1 Tax=Elizabethkingia anophelis TaxID=1117645 RepID=UPI00038A321C|nr:hypothetical protein [Elizabethkingia anophelis]EQB92812.1 hypothetical protein C874_18015 [Elizabethkingia anophelis 502]
MQGVSKFLFTIEYNKRDLKYLMNSLYLCYKKIISEVSSISHKENDIRDVFISENYLESHKVREELGVKEFQFDKEISTLEGRADIRIFNMIEKLTGIEKPYYYIECKVLNNSKPSTAGSNLYSKYINNGIKRYIDGVYPTHNESNGMLGFFIKPANIQNQCKFFSELKPHFFIEGFDLSYISKHTVSDSKKIILYHLMLDFSSKINPSLN